MPPSPTPIDVFVHSGAAEWWQILAALGPLAVLLGAVVAGVIGWNTLRQRTAADAKALAQKVEADNRSEWWRRTQWALDGVYSGNKKLGTAGLKVLGVLGKSPLAGPGELAVLEAAWEQPLAAAEQRIMSQEHTSPLVKFVTTVTVPEPIRTTDGVSGRPDPQARVDGEPGQRDNGEGPIEETEGGAR